MFPYLFDVNLFFYVFVLTPLVHSLVSGAFVCCSSYLLLYAASLLLFVRTVWFMHVSVQLLRDRCMGSMLGWAFFGQLASRLFYCRLTDCTYEYLCSSSPLLHFSVLALSSCVLRMTARGARTEAGRRPPKY